MDPVDLAGEREQKRQRRRSRSISLSSVRVVLPESLNEKHFAAEFADLVCSARFLVSIWHLLKQVRLNLGKAWDEFQ